MSDGHDEDQEKSNEKEEQMNKDNSKKKIEIEENKENQKNKYVKSDDSENNFEFFNNNDQNNIIMNYDSSNPKNYNTHPKNSINSIKLNMTKNSNFQNNNNNLMFYNSEYRDNKINDNFKNIQFNNMNNNKYSYINNVNRNNSSNYNMEFQNSGNNNFVNNDMNYYPPNHNYINNLKKRNINTSNMYNINNDQLYYMNNNNSNIFPHQKVPTMYSNINPNNKFINFQGRIIPNNINRNNNQKNNNYNYRLDNKFDFYNNNYNYYDNNEIYNKNIPNINNRQNNMQYNKINLNNISPLNNNFINNDIQNDSNIYYNNPEISLQNINNFQSQNEIIPDKSAYNINNYSQLNNNNFRQFNELNQNNNNQVFFNDNEEIVSYDSDNIDNNYQDNNNNELFKNKNNLNNINTLKIYKEQNNQNQIQSVITNEINNNRDLNEMLKIINNVNMINNNYDKLQSKIYNNFMLKLKNNIPIEEKEPITLYYLEEFDKKNELEKYNIEFNLYNANVGIFQKINFPSISIDNIKNRIEILKYTLTEDDKKILDDFNKLNFVSSSINDIFVFHKNIFYSQNKMSLYLPHILKDKKDITSIFLNENQKQLSIYDFQYMYSHKGEHILKKLLEKRVSQFNNRNLDKKIYGFHENYMYTIMDKEIVENKLKKTDIKMLKENLLPNKSEIYSLNTNKLSKNDEYFILTNNINYLKGLSFEQTILYGILTRLNEYTQLPNIIFYECYMNINGEKIIKSNENILPGYQEIDYALYSVKDFCFDKINFPLYVQSEYYFDKNDFKRDENGHIFKIYKNKIYFFEFKHFLNNYKININNNDKKTKDINEFLNNLVKKCKEFTNLYTKTFSIPEDTQIEIILVYDDDYNSIFSKCIETLKILLKNEKIRFSLIYVLSNYPYMSLMSAVEENLDTKRKMKELSNKIIELEKEIKNIKMGN